MTERGFRGGTQAKEKGGVHKNPPRPKKKRVFVGSGLKRKDKGNFLGICQVVKKKRGGTEGWEKKEEGEGKEERRERIL